MAAQAAPAAPAPRTHLVWAILVTCLCFLPLGLIAIAYAWRTSVLIGRGDLERARRTSRAAKGWAITALVVGILVDAILIAALALLGAFGS
jgi:hypothetical protein